MYIETFSTIQIVSESSYSIPPAWNTNIREAIAIDPLYITSHGRHMHACRSVLNKHPISSFGTITKAVDLMLSYTVRNGEFGLLL